MDIEDKVQLSWPNFENNLFSFVSALQNNPAFSDVTLVTEDDCQIETNKVVLSASSLFFRNILTKNTHPHPLIYLRGICSEDLKSLIDFIFNGEVQIKQERVSSFMSVSEDLQIKGFLEEFVGQQESYEKLEAPIIETIKIENTEYREHVVREIEVVATGRNKNTMGNIPVF